MRSIIMSLVCIFAVLACGPKKNMIVSARDQEFYTQWVNSSNDSASVEKNLASYKIVQTGSDRAMRFVLFDNNTFYYQVDRLGNGTGTWSYFEGGLELTAQRPVFDMILFLSAAAAQGDGLTFRFHDRFGLNTLLAHVREPFATNNKPLGKFTTSPKGI